MKSQTDKLGQPVTIGANVVATFMHGRSHHFMRGKVVSMTPQFAVVGSPSGRESGIFPRRVAFYNTLVIDKLLPTEKAGLVRAYDIG